ncbi:SCAN domain-containing protein 3-like [Gadus macrocephalus]|uniref:SCAN domain-containing protein 3-like n=1 Tax=Gadus macrocephalus TaxID=80720 RepID=UPI0028CB76D9|nr:SCAN domain-containing protein 3-like [Gadus macrocephalus]
MEQSPLASVLGHLAQTAERQTQLQQALPVGGPLLGRRPGGHAGATRLRDRLGLSPEEHRRRFQALAFIDGVRPFTYAQQLRDQARRWLGPERNTQEEIVEQVGLERFVEGLPTRTSTWIRYHQPGSLSAAVNIGEGHLAPPLSDRRPPIPQTGAAGLQPDRPIPGPRARWGGGPSQEQAHSAPSHPIPQKGTQTAGEACWRCRQPGHLRIRGGGGRFSTRGPSAEIPTGGRFPPRAVS